MKQRIVVKTHKLFNKYHPNGTKYQNINGASFKYKGEKIGTIENVAPHQKDKAILTLVTKKEKAFFEQMEADLGKKLLYRPLISLKETLVDNSPEV